MTIDVSPETGAQLKMKAQSEGVSVGVYVERLMLEAESRRMQLAAFRQTIHDRIAPLRAGDSMDGEEVMARLIDGINAPDRLPGVR